MSTAEQREQWRKLAATNDTWGMKFRNDAINGLLADVDRLTAERDALAAQLAQRTVTITPNLDAYNPG